MERCLVRLAFAVDDRVEASGVLVKMENRRAQLTQHNLPLPGSLDSVFESSDLAFPMPGRSRERRVITTIRPRSLRKELRSQLTALTRHAPKSAAQKPRTANPGTMREVSHRHRAFKTKRKKPRVTKVNGRVRNKRIGRTKALMSPRMRPATRAGTIPLISIPGTTAAAKKIAKAFASTRIRKPMDPVYSRC